MRRAAVPGLVWGSHGGFEGSRCETLVGVDESQPKFLPHNALDIAVEHAMAVAHSCRPIARVGCHF